MAAPQMFPSIPDLARSSLNNRKLPSQIKQINKEMKQYKILTDGIY